jgi:hypothetical protein
MGFVELLAKAKAQASDLARASVAVFVSLPTTLFATCPETSLRTVDLPFLQCSPPLSLGEAQGLAPMLVAARPRGPRLSVHVARPPRRGRSPRAPRDPRADPDA